jgi:hypothetical protein
MIWEHAHVVGHADTPNPFCVLIVSLARRYSVTKHGRLGGRKVHTPKDGRKIQVCNKSVGNGGVVYLAVYLNPRVIEIDLSKGNLTQTDVGLNSLRRQ